MGAYFFARTHIMAFPLHNSSLFRPGAATEVAIGIASVQSAALSADCRAVLLVATSACRVALGAAPVAVATSTYLPPNVPQLFIVSGADKVAVIQEAAAGKLSITELTS